MYGAVPYLMKSFHLDRDTAFAIVCQWLDQQPPAEPPPPSQRRKRQRRST
jgi:hypothetical protein